MIQELAFMALSFFLMGSFGCFAMMEFTWEMFFVMGIMGVIVACIYIVGSHIQWGEKQWV